MELEVERSTPTCDLIWVLPILNLMYTVNILVCFKYCHLDVDIRVNIHIRYRTAAFSVIKSGSVI